MSEIEITIVAGLVAMLCWGSADVFAKKAIDEAGSLVSQFISLIFIIFFSSLYFLVDLSLPELSLEQIVILVALSFMDFVGFLALYTAYRIGKVSIINPITSSYAILAAIVSFALFGESFSLAKLFIVLLVVIGIIFVSVDFNDLKDKVSKKDLAKGVPLAILVFCIYGFYVPFWDRALDGEGWFALTQLARLMTLTFSAIAIVLTKEGKTLKKGLKNKRIVVFLALNGLILAIGNNAFNLGLHEIDQTSILAAIASSYPVSLVIAAYIYLRERIATNQYFGIGIIVVGIVLISLVG